MPEVWVPGMAGPHEEFVARLLRQIERFAADAGVERAYVEIELDESSRFVLDSVSPEPGFGFVTLRPHQTGEPQVPDELIVPLGAIRRIELSRAVEPRAGFGFRIA